MTTTVDTTTQDVILSVENLVVDFPMNNGATAHAVADVSFDVRRGETLGIVGESGCGKSSTARAILQLPSPTSGSVTLNGQELTALRPNKLRRARRDIQIILQDPISALNPRRAVSKIVGEGLDIWDVADRTARVRDVMSSVGLDYDVVGGRLASEFSGGQCQRISIARALALEPEVLICDEPVSALDVSVQAQIINLLEDLKEKYSITLLFVSHDLGVIKIVSDRVMVMYLGKVVELGPTESLYERPLHPYTRMLLDAIPDAAITARSHTTPRGEIPSITNPPSGCPFRSRCDRATDECASTMPAQRELYPGHHVACHHPLTASEPSQTASEPSSR